MTLIDIPRSIRRDLPPALIAKLSPLDPLVQEAFLVEFRRQRKSIHLAFWLFLFGFHYLYLRKIVVQIFFWFTLGGLGIWYLIDLFRCPGMLRIRNQAIAIQVFRDVQVLT